MKFLHNISFYLLFSVIFYVLAACEKENDNLSFTKYDTIFLQNYTNSDFTFWENKIIPGTILSSLPHKIITFQATKIWVYYDFSTYYREILYVKSKKNGSFERKIYFFDDGGYTFNFYYDYVDSIQRKNYCYNYFEKLPKIREANAKNTHKVIHKSNPNIEQFNDLISFLDSIPQDNFYELLYLTQVVPTYYGFDAPRYSLNESNYIWNSLPNVISDSAQIFNFFKISLFPKTQNPWINEQKEFVKQYFENFLSDKINKNSVVIYTLPDMKIFYFDIENGYIKNKEYIDRSYKWLHPFLFFRIIGRPEYGDDYFGEKSIYDL